MTAHPAWLRALAEDLLDTALGAMVDREHVWLPVEEDGRLVGVLSKRDVTTTYRRAVAGNVRRVSAAGDTGGRLIDVDVARDSALAGLALAEAPLPREAVVVSIERGGETVVPRGDTTIEAGDRLSVFTTPDGREQLLDALAGR